MQRYSALNSSIGLKGELGPEKPDIVEFNPSQDVGGITAGVAAKFVKELAAQWIVESD